MLVFQSSPSAWTFVLNETQQVSNKRKIREALFFLCQTIELNSTITYRCRNFKILKSQQLLNSYIPVVIMSVFLKKSKKQDEITEKKREFCPIFDTRTANFIKRLQKTVRLPSENCSKTRFLSNDCVKI